MPRLTKKEKVAQFYYNTTKLSKAMEQYELCLSRATLLRNRRKIADKNEMGRIQEQRAEEMTQLDKAVLETEGLSDGQMNLACEAFDALKKLLD